MNDLKTTVNVQEYHNLTKVKSEDLLEVIIKKLTELKSQIQEKNSKPTSPPVYRLSSASLKPKPHFKKVVKTSEDSQEKCLKISQIYQSYSAVNDKVVPQVVGLRISRCKVAIKPCIFKQTKDI